jgi:MerR family transcriptional regulator, redox-sensitive transcriptional activator SoxR
MANFTIGEVARRAGLSASAIRYYEKIGLLPKTKRIGGQRRYEPSVLSYLAVIDVAKRAGFRMDEIRRLFHGFGKGTPAFRRWQLLAQRKITEMDDLIARAKKMKRLLENADRCKCFDLEDCGKVFLVQSTKKVLARQDNARVSGPPGCRSRSSSLPRSCRRLLRTPVQSDRNPV